VWISVDGCFGQAALLIEPNRGGPFRLKDHESMRTLEVEVRWAKIALYFYVAQAAAGAAIGFAIPFLHLIAE
jgi:hypothetical protein